MMVIMVMIYYSGGAIENTQPLGGLGSSHPLMKA